MKPANKIIERLPLIVLGGGLVLVLLLNIFAGGIKTGHNCSRLDNQGTYSLDNSSKTEEKKTLLKEVIERINEQLPRQYGGIAIFEKVSLIEDTLGYYYSIIGNPNQKLDSLYENSQNELRSILLSNIFHAMNERNELGTMMANIMKECKIHMKAYFRTPSDRVFEIHIKDTEPAEYLQKIKKSPASAEKEILLASLKLIGFQLRSLKRTGLEFDNIASSSVESLRKQEEEILVDITNIDNAVRFVYLVSNSENFAVLKSASQEIQLKRQLVRNLAMNPNFKELMKTMALCNLDFEIEYTIQDSNDNVVVNIPCVLLWDEFVGK